MGIAAGRMQAPDALDLVVLGAFANRGRTGAR
jgi:hypothetical protein